MFFAEAEQHYIHTQLVGEDKWFGGGKGINDFLGEGGGGGIQSYDITWSKMTSKYDNVNFSADLFQPKNTPDRKIFSPAPFSSLATPPFLV